MSDPAKQDEPPEDSPSEPEEGYSILGGSIFSDIKLAFLAGAAFAAFQWGGEAKDRLAKWIDGEPYTQAAAPVLPDPEAGVWPESEFKGGDPLGLADFRLNTGEDWRIERMIGPMRAHEYFGRLLDPTLEVGRHDSALILTEPDARLITLPDDAGQVLLLSKGVIINRRPSVDMVEEALDNAPIEDLNIVALDDLVTEGGQADRRVEDEPGPFVLRGGSVDSATISENDLFDRYFLEQVSTMLSLRKTHGSVDLKHLRRRSVDGYEIGEIDYVIGTGTLRLSAVFYWHLEAGAVMGDFGLSLVLRREPVDERHKALFETVSSLRIVNGEHEIWRGLDFEAPADADSAVYMHVDLDAPRLLARGLDLHEIEQVLETQFPISAGDLQDVVIARQGDQKVLLRDIARLDLYPVGDDDMLRGPQSIVLTVTQ